MLNREFYTADGRDWYEPRSEDCKEQFSEVQSVVLCHTCITCGQRIGTPDVRVYYNRTRTYTMKGMVPQWSEWSKWELVGYEHLNGCPE